MHSCGNGVLMVNNKQIASNQEHSKDLPLMYKELTDKEYVGPEGHRDVGPCEIAGPGHRKGTKGQYTQ
eukprot:9029954-Karenia_brevis.AAC.1